MSGFENYFREAVDIEREIERKGVVLGVDWNNPLQVRELARDALTARLNAGDYGGQLSPEERARIDLYGLAQLMLTVMRESADENLQMHGGAVWKLLGRALWQEAMSLGLVTPALNSGAGDVLKSPAKH